LEAGRKVRGDVGRFDDVARTRYIFHAHNVDVDVKNNVVMVGPPVLLDIDLIETIKPRWAGPVPANGTRIHVQIRAHGDALPATLHVGDDGLVMVQLDDYLRGLAAGQAAVFYDGTRVIGSATVSRSRRSATV
jgi:tRNA-specific 2-thiouridylase